MSETLWLNIHISEVNYIERNCLTMNSKNKSCFVFSCRTEGQGTFYYNNKTFSVSRGDILYIPLNAAYSQKTESEKVVYIHMDISGAKNRKINVYRPESEEEADKICLQFEKINDLWSNKKSGYYYACLSELYNIIAETGIIHEKSESSIPECILSSAEYINLHYQEHDFQLTDAIRSAGIGSTYFYSQFKKSYGKTPAKYVNDLRITKSKSLLKTGLYTSEEISSLCGFNDVKYFFTVFKSITGKTTKEFISDFQ